VPPTQVLPLVLGVLGCTSFLTAQSTAPKVTGYGQIRLEAIGD